MLLPKKATHLAATIADAFVTPSQLVVLPERLSNAAWSYADLSVNHAQLRDAISSEAHKKMN